MNASVVLHERTPEGDVLHDELVVDQATQLDIVVAHPLCPGLSAIVGGRAVLVIARAALRHGAHQPQQADIGDKGDGNAPQCAWEGRQGRV